jgi:ribosome-associated protein
MTSPKRPGRSGPARRKPGAKSASTAAPAPKAKSAPRAGAKPGKAVKPARNAPAVRASKPKAPTPKAPALAPLVKLVLAALEDMKAQDVRTLDVRGLTDIADTMIIASGTSDRHVKSIAQRVVQQSKAAGKRPFGVEGERDGEWVLVDLPDVMVHVMLPRVREFYALEQLWEPVRSAPAAGKPGGRSIAT